MKRTVLFLCTGNYYRSRFAEELFNSFASEQRLGWRAASRALAPDLGVRNVGAISPHALRGLAARGLTLVPPIRYPRALQPFELALADHIVALNECEHRPLLASRFAEWQDRVEYWLIEDVDRDVPDNVLPKLESSVRDLIACLARRATTES